MLDPIDSSSNQFLLAMDGLNKRLDRAQQQVSSGKRIQTASDSPDNTSGSRFMATSCRRPLMLSNGRKEQR